MSTDVLPATIADVPTPCFLVDIDKVKRNCQRMRDITDNMGVNLRPMLKTHKTVEIGDIATAGTRRCVVVSTLSEAEFFASNGFDDIILAQPISKHKIPSCQKLTNQLNKFHVMYDSMEALEWIKEAQLSPGKKWSVVLKVDTGLGRAGVLWDGDDVISLAKAATDADNVMFLGIYAHCGQSYDCKGETELKTFGTENTNKLLSIQKRLKAAGIECPMVATGSTPSCSKPADNMSALTEFHPGNYVFYDLVHFHIGVCTLDDIAVRIATRVVSHKPSLNQLLVDAGLTAMHNDSINLCVVQGHPNLRLVGLGMELGKLRPVDGDMEFEKYPLGTMLYYYPYIACCTATLHPVYYVHSGDKIVGVWKPTRGW